MEYRALGRTGYSVSRLGFGSMRPPMMAIGNNRYIDFDGAVETLHTAFQLGVNYVDCGFLYGGEQSEIAVGRALRTWPARDDIVVTTKATKFRMERPGDLRRMIEHQLQRLERDWVHFYLFHGIGWDNYYELDKKTSWIGDMIWVQEQGLAKHVGFSFHDEPARMKDLIDLGWAELVTCQYNYLDQRNAEAMAYAHAKGVAVVVMGPIGGGRLAVLPKGVDHLLGLRHEDAAGLALRFVASNPHVDVAISGMGSPDTVRQNVAALDIGPLVAADVVALNGLMDRYRDLAKLYCTGCDYCKPCPNRVNISRCFELYNYLTVYGLEQYAREQYGMLLEEGNDASHCLACGDCLERCPQRLAIPGQLEIVRDAFAVA